MQLSVFLQLLNDKQNILNLFILCVYFKEKKDFLQYQLISNIKHSRMVVQNQNTVMEQHKDI